MKKLGTVPIPENRYQKFGNRTQFARQMVDDLVPGKADLYEFADKKEAMNIRSTIFSIAAMKYGPGHHIATSIVENTMYIWLINGEPEGKEE